MQRPEPGDCTSAGPWADVSRKVNARASTKDREVVAPPIDAALLQRQAIGELAGGVAHQLSTPLQAVAANLQFLAHAWTQLAPLLNTTAVPSADIRFVVEEVPQAIAQSLRSLEQASVLLRAMKESCAEAGTTLDAVEPAKALDTALLLTQNRWRYTTSFRVQHIESLPTLRCRRPDLNALLTQLILWIATEAEPQPRAELREIHIACAAEDRGVSLALGPLPPRAHGDDAWWHMLVALAQAVSGELSHDFSSGHHGVRLRLPIVASAAPA
jgi:signal transduction histidine kinase